MIKTLKKIWAWPKPFLTPKRDRFKTQCSLLVHPYTKRNPRDEIKWRFALNTLSETKIQNLHPKARRRAFPPLSCESSPPLPRDGAIDFALVVLVFAVLHRADDSQSARKSRTRLHFDSRFGLYHVAIVFSTQSDQQLFEQFICISAWFETGYIYPYYEQTTIVESDSPRLRTTSLMGLNTTTSILRPLYFFASRETRLILTAVKQTKTNKVGYIN